MAQAFRCPRQLQLVAPGELGVYRIVNDTDYTLLGIRDSCSDFTPKLSSTTEVGLVEKPGRVPDAGRLD